MVSRCNRLFSTTLVQIYYLLATYFAIFAEKLFGLDATLLAIFSIFPSFFVSFVEKTEAVVSSGAKTRHIRTRYVKS